MYYEIVFIGIVSGLLGIFYRNCLKVKNMIFNKLYTNILKPWANSDNPILSFVAHPLGYCIYCSTTWIGFFLTALYFSEYKILPPFQDIIISVLAVTGINHLIVASACRWLIFQHPDLDEDFGGGD